MLLKLHFGRRDYMLARLNSVRQLELADHDSASFLSPVLYNMFPTLCLS